MALDDITLLNEVDENYEAGRTVMSAHIRPGIIQKSCVAVLLISYIHSKE